MATVARIDAPSVAILIEATPLSRVPRFSYDLNFFLAVRIGAGHGAT
jgi:hypothetical protein